MKHLTRTGKPLPKAITEQAKKVGGDLTSRREFLAMASAIHSSDNPFLGSAQIPALQAELRSSDLSRHKRIDTLGRLCFDLLRWGRLDEALAAIDEALELAEHRIRVNCLAPDMIATPGSRGVGPGPVPDTFPPRPPELQAAVERYIPLQREGHVDEIASAAVFLSSAMGAYITGAILPVDGGTWASSGWVRTREGRGFGLFEPWLSAL